MATYIVQTAAACMPSSCKFGRYRRVAVLEVADPSIHRVAMISARAIGVIRIVRRWERLSVGTTERCAYRRALAEARALVATLSNGGA
jgi:hypothetical protein